MCTVLIHGYHPLSEDGGIYVAGIQTLLNPTLFPHDLPFALATRHYSLFAALSATIVETLHAPLPYLLLFAAFAGAVLLLFAAYRIASRCTRLPAARLCAVALLAVWFALPIAGTSLLLMDPYVTARTFSTPLSLLAIAFAIDFRWPATLRQLLKPAVCLFAAAAFHPLMAAYAGFFVVALLIARLPTRPIRNLAWIALASTAFAAAAFLQALAPPESAATLAAAVSRYYWFLAQWQWFELAGLAGPICVLALLLRFARYPVDSTSTALCRAAVATGLIAIAIAAVFAQQHFSTHLVARLQPLRTFLLLYAVMIVLLGVALAERLWRHRGANRVWLSPALASGVLLALAFVMFYAERQTYTASDHLELPWRPASNPWSQAFVWARLHTPPDALFALDADYITTRGEDAQTFRSTAERSALPDFSKDGGEAAIRPALADIWFAGQFIQRGLSASTPSRRARRLQPLGVTWLVLHANAKTDGACPYANSVVKVCPLITEKAAALSYRSP